ncbi:hypothetical protein B932_1629 [Gluconobacter oxydans H24]|nr:hypothetical protein B932_1629 [Gluconobacter oxydans H24]
MAEQESAQRGSLEKCSLIVLLVVKEHRKALASVKKVKVLNGGQHHC